MRIGIIGAGHAGVESARSVASSGNEAVLFCGEQFLPYYRPRVVAYAFGQSTLQDCLMHDEGWYRQNGITLRQRSLVSSINTASVSVAVAGAEEQFDGLILSTGAAPLVPDAFKGARNVMPLWTLEDAERIRGVLKPGGKLIIIGGGVIGIETALRAADVGVSVVVLEKMDKIMAQHLTLKTSQALCVLLEQKRVSLLCGVTVKALRQSGDTVQVTMNDESLMQADVVLVSMGAARDLSLFRKAGITCDRGVIADEYMMTSSDKVFVCGDIAQTGHVLRCSARNAMAQAKCATGNLLASLSGGAMVPYISAYEPLMMKYKDTELYAAGILPADGYDEEVIPDAELEAGYAVRIKSRGITAGIQIVGRGKGLMRYLKEVK